MNTLVLIAVIVVLVIIIIICAVLLKKDDSEEETGNATFSGKEPEDVMNENDVGADRKNPGDRISNGYPNGEEPNYTGRTSNGYPNGEGSNYTGRTSNGYPNREEPNYTGRTSNGYPNGEGSNYTGRTSNGYPNTDSRTPGSGSYGEYWKTEEPDPYTNNSTALNRDTGDHSSNVGGNFGKQSNMWGGNDPYSTVGAGYTQSQNPNYPYNNDTSDVNKFTETVETRNIPYHTIISENQQTSGRNDAEYGTTGREKTYTSRPPYGTDFPDETESHVKMVDFSAFDTPEDNQPQDNLYNTYVQNMNFNGQAAAQKTPSQKYARPVTHMKSIILDDPNGYHYEAKSDGIIRIGRNSNCEIRILEDNTVSGIHCIVSCFEDGTVMIRDNGSSNGTYLNDKKVTEEKVLKNGDVLEIGRIQYNVWLK